MADMPSLRDIVNGTAADATDVEWNFNTIETHIESELVRVDGDNPMGATLDLGSNKIINLAAATLVSDAPRFDQSGFGSYETTGAGVTVGTSATTIETVSVAMPAAGLALVAFSGSLTTAGVTYPSGSAVQCTFAIAGGSSSLQVASTGVLSITSNTTEPTAAVFVVSLPSGTTVLTLQGTRINAPGGGGSPSGGTLTADTGFKLAVIGAF